MLPDRLEATIDSPHRQPVVAEWRRREETRLRAIRRVVVVLARVFHAGGFPRPLCTSASPPSNRLTACPSRFPNLVLSWHPFFSSHLSHENKVLLDLSFSCADKAEGWLPGGRERGQ